MAGARDEAERILLRDGAQEDSGIIRVRPPFISGYAIIREPGQFPRLVPATVDDPSLRVEPPRELTLDGDPSLVEPS